MIEFSDILYGKILLPEWMIPFLRTPEFVRLRGVRLSNVDSFQFKDFNGPSRWEHCIAVAFLALRCAEKRRMSEKESVHLSLAALLHDVATPPYAHTLEHVLEGFDHEIESQRILRAVTAGDADPSFPVFASELPQFHKTCERVSKQLGFVIEPEEVARLVIGEGELGFLLNGTLDLDNADNVTRASLHLGIEIDRQVPFGLADYLASQDGPPLNLSEVGNDSVTKWLRYRKQLYSAFFNSSDAELGRQAFLQHLCRQAIEVGVPRQRMVWNTDDGLLHLFEEFGKAGSGLREKVLRYRLLEPPVEIADVSIEDSEALRVLSAPSAIQWIENSLKGHSFEPFVLLNSRRYDECESQQSLFPPPAGALRIYKLADAFKANQLPEWVKAEMPSNVGSAHSIRGPLSDLLRKKLSVWIRDRPWARLTAKRKLDLKTNLDAVGDWSFRLSRNDTLHSYPSTFVHAIPACLINSLGLRGDLIVDPFGGTGQTAIEAILSGGRAITTDVNHIAVLIARSKLTFLTEGQRRRLKAITAEEILDYAPGKLPNFELVDKWHHHDTLLELCRLRTFVGNQKDESLAQFLLAAFSAILTSATARKGKEHGFFADNTPLSKETSAPPYENAIALFLTKLRRNVAVIERLYSIIERAGRDPEVELKRATSKRLDITKANAEDFDIPYGSVGGVITSPPYLCMSDYSLGQRLSYYWLFPEKLSEDHKSEVGARRRRFRSEVALEEYLADFGRFAEIAAKLLRPGGFLATVLGAPTATSFSRTDVLKSVDDVLQKRGFEILWSTWRPINWHRNHGYARLKKERIAVYGLR